MDVLRELVARSLAVTTFAGSDAESAFALEADQFLRWGVGPSLDTGSIVAIYAPKSARAIPQHERGVIRHLFRVARPTYPAHKGYVWRNIAFLHQRASLRQAVTLEEMQDEDVITQWRLPNSSFRGAGRVKKSLTLSEAKVFWRLVGRRNDLEALTGLLRLPTTNVQNRPRTSNYPIDVAISYAGEDRVVAKRLTKALEATGLKVFFDEFIPEKLFGAELFEKLADIFENKARFCMPILSVHYTAKVWTRHELRSAFARVLVSDDEYLLPVRLDDTDVPGIRGNTGYLDLRSTTIDRVVAITKAKVDSAAAA